MNIIISNTGTVPIYEQIVAQIKAAILSGKLKEGDMLPSMRVLAAELRISVITTKRAYEELEREGFTVSQTGRGSFVAAGNLDFIRDARLREIEARLMNILPLARESGVTLQELTQLLTMLYQEEG